jgi:hypothetical protein
LRLVTTVPLTSSQPYRETVDVQVDATVHEVVLDAVLAAPNVVDVVVPTTRAALTGAPEAHHQVPVSAHLRATTTRTSHSTAPTRPTTR